MIDLQYIRVSLEINFSQILAKTESIIVYSLCSFMKYYFPQRRAKT